MRNELSSPGAGFLRSPRSQGRSPRALVSPAIAASDECERDFREGAFRPPTRHTNAPGVDITAGRRAPLMTAKPTGPLGTFATRPGASVFSLRPSRRGIQARSENPTIRSRDESGDDRASRFSDRPRSRRPAGVTPARSRATPSSRSEEDASAGQGRRIAIVVRTPSSASRIAAFLQEPPSRSPGEPVRLERDLRGTSTMFSVEPVWPWR